MEQKLDQIETLLDELQCPLLAKPSNPLPVTEDSNHFEEHYGSKLLHLILPTEQRILLFSWLLQKYDPIILECKSIQSSPNNEIGSNFILMYRN